MWRGDLGGRLRDHLIGWPDEVSVAYVGGGVGYVIDTRDPARLREIDALRVVDVLVLPRHELVLFAAWQDVLAYGRDGLVWRADDVACDEIEFKRLDGDVLHARGYRGGYKDFEIDARTGRVCSTRKFTE